MLTIPRIQDWNRPGNKLPIDAQTVFAIIDEPDEEAFVAMVQFFGNEFMSEFRFRGSAVNAIAWLPYIAGGLEPGPIKASKRMEDMTEPELGLHLKNQMKFIKASQTEDTIGSMLIIFQENKITQYGSTIAAETAPPALRELADRLESRSTVER